MEAAFIPEVNDDLDTQNFEKFDEVCSSFLHIHTYFVWLHSESVSVIYHKQIVPFTSQSNSSSQPSSRISPWRKVITVGCFTVTVFLSPQVADMFTNQWYVSVDRPFWQDKGEQRKSITYHCLNHVSSFLLQLCLSGKYKKLNLH